MASANGELIKKLWVQQRMVISLFRAGSHSKVGVIVRDEISRDSLSLRIWDQLDWNLFTYNKSQHTIYGTNGESKMVFIPHTALHKFEGLELDLLWVKYRDNITDAHALSKLIARVRVGYNPLILEGEVNGESISTKKETAGVPATDLR